MNPGLSLRHIVRRAGRPAFVDIGALGREVGSKGVDHAGQIAQHRGESPGP